MTRAMPIDEVCFRITDALRAGRLDGWARGFAASVAKNLKRPNWCPSQKQEAVMNPGKTLLVLAQIATTEREIEFPVRRDYLYLLGHSNQAI